MKAWTAATMILALAGAAEAGGFAPATTVTSITTASGAAERLEWVRYIGPRIGRDVTVQTNAGVLSTIEWHRDMQVRVRTESGALLAPSTQDSVQAQALTCDRGEVRGATRRLEPNGTLVIDYDCAWLQSR